MSERFELISVLQVVGIILVVWGHAFFGHESIVLTWIYTFHMPLFMAISGFLLAYTSRKKGTKLSEIPFKKFIAKKAKRLLVPYVVIGSLTYPIKAYLSKFAIRPLDMGWEGYIHSMLYPWDNSIIYFWFLPVLFTIFVIVISTVKLSHYFRFNISRKYVGVILLLISVFLNIFNPLADIEFLALGTTINYLVYFLLGYFSEVMIQQIDNMSLKSSTFGFVITFVISCLLLNSDFMIYPEIQSLLEAFNGIAMAIFFSKTYINLNFNWLKMFFGSSYTIYLLSWYPQSFCGQFLAHFLKIDWTILSILSVLTGMLLPWLIYKYIKSKIKPRDTNLNKFICLVVGI